MPMQLMPNALGFPLLYSSQSNLARLLYEVDGIRLIYRKGALGFKFMQRNVTTLLLTCNKVRRMP